MNPCTPFPWGPAQGNRELPIGRRLQVLLMGGLLVLAPSTVHTLIHCESENAMNYITTLKQIVLDKLAPEVESNTTIDGVFCDQGNVTGDDW